MTAPTRDMWGGVGVDVQPPKVGDRVRVRNRWGVTDSRWAGHHGTVVGLDCVGHADLAVDVEFHVRGVEVVAIAIADLDVVGNINWPRALPGDVVRSTSDDRFKAYSARVLRTDERGVLIACQRESETCTLTHGEYVIMVRAAHAIPKAAIAPGDYVRVKGTTFNGWTGLARKVSIAGVGTKNHRELVDVHFGEGRSTDVTFNARDIELLPAPKTSYVPLYTDGGTDHVKVTHNTPELGSPQEIEARRQKYAAEHAANPDEPCETCGRTDEITNVHAHTCAECGIGYSCLGGCPLCKSTAQNAELRERANNAESRASEARDKLGDVRKEARGEYVINIGLLAENARLRRALEQAGRKR